MLRLGIILLALGFIAQCSALSLEHGKMLERLKRSPYDCFPPPLPPPPPPPPPPYWPPPPPPFWPPPPPPPFWHHHYHGPDFGPGSRSESDYQSQQTDQNQSSNGQFSNQNSQPSQPNLNGQLISQNSQPNQQNPNEQLSNQNNQPNQNGQLISQNSQPAQPPSPPCDTCGNKGQSSAVSNSQSVNGDAISISISKGNNRR